MDIEELKNKSEFYHFGILPQRCIHSPLEDEYSKIYKAREKCDCGSSKWIEEGCTVILGYYPDGTLIHKDVHRCMNCFEIRFADHIGINNYEDNQCS